MVLSFGLSVSPTRYFGEQLWLFSTDSCRWARYYLATGQYHLNHYWLNLGRVTILITGGVVISFIDNLLRPVLVGRGAKMPDAIVLLATIGGLTTFGVSGFVVSPIVAAFFLSLWIMFEESFIKNCLETESPDFEIT